MVSPNSRTKHQRANTVTPIGLPRRTRAGHGATAPEPNTAPVSHLHRDASAFAIRSVAAIASGVVLIALALLVLVPQREGTWRVGLGGNGPNPVVTSIQPDSPLLKLGLRRGDTIAVDRMSLPDRLAFVTPKARTPVTWIVLRGQAVLRMTVTPLSLPPAYTPATIAAWILAVIYAAMVMLVAWRAPASRERTLIVAMLGALCVAYTLASIGTATAQPTLMLLLYIVSDLCIAAFMMASILFAVTFPRRQSALQRYMQRFGVPIYAVVAVLFVLDELNGAGVVPLGFDLSSVDGIAQIIGALVLLTAVIDGIVHAQPRDRLAARVAGSTLLILAAVDAIMGVAECTNAFSPGEFFDLLQWASGFGVTYAVLRHRLVDVNLFISRAAIFSAVSIAVIVIFLFGEWALSSLLEEALGSAFSERGRTSLAVVVALCVGMSARGVHKIIEHRLNHVFFAKRYRALADLRRLGLETDSATDPTALLNLTYTALRRDLEAQYVGIYTGTPERGYISIGTTDAQHLPLRLDQNEETVLRLRRWGESFIVDNEAHPLHRAFVSPMMLRGTLYGFAICGPKADHTSYLPDEEAAVAGLIHRVGIAYEWLTRSVYAV